VLKSGVGGQDGVVGLDNRVGDLGCRVDGELELALLAIVDRETFHEQGTEAGTGTTTEGVEDQEALETSAVISDTPNLVKNLVDKLLADSVVTTSVVVGRILLASDHVLGVEERAVGAGADFIDNIGLEIAVDSAGDIFALTFESRQYCLFFQVHALHTSLREEGAEALIRVGGLAFGCEVAIGLWDVSAMFWRRR
jgi:hypothetical protein